MRSFWIAIVLVLLSHPSAFAEDCSQLAPDTDRFREAMESSRLQESEIRSKLKRPRTIQFTLTTLNQYDALITQALTLVDDAETRSNKVQENRCPGWDEPEKMSEMSLVIKNLKARFKKTRSQVAASISKFEAAMKKGHAGLVSVTFD